MAYLQCLCHRDIDTEFVKDTRVLMFHQSAGIMASYSISHELCSLCLL